MIILTVHFTDREGILGTNWDKNRSHHIVHFTSSLFAISGQSAIAAGRPALKLWPKIPSTSSPRCGRSSSRTQFTRTSAVINFPDSKENTGLLLFTALLLSSYKAFSSVRDTEQSPSLDRGRL